MAKALIVRCKSRNFGSLEPSRPKPHRRSSLKARRHGERVWIVEKCHMQPYMDPMSAPSPAIANEFIRRAGLHARHLTHMQLQKLVYIAHGWNLAINGAPLTDDVPQAWDYGPVYKDIYDALRRYGSGPVIGEIKAGDYGVGVFIQDTATANEPVRATLSEKERAVVERVFSDYGKFHAFQLSALTHQDGTPWDQVYNHGAGRLSPIDNFRVKSHFIDLASHRRQSA